MTKASDNLYPSVLLVETAGASVDTPSGGDQRLFVDTDHLAKLKNSSAVVTPIGGGGSGALTLLEQHTASSSASLDFTTFISSTYDTYKIEGTELVIQTNTAHLLMEVGTGGGPTYDTGSNYEFIRQGVNTQGTAKLDYSSVDICRVFTSMATAAGYGTGSFSMTVDALQSTALRKTFRGDLQYVSTDPTDNSIFAIWGCQWTVAGTAATALRFIPSSGNIVSGTIRIYGLAKS